MAPTTRQVVGAIAERGGAGFHASYVARKAEIDSADAHRQLGVLARDGLVDIQVEAICPNCSRTISVWEHGHAMKIGANARCDSCTQGEFQVSDDNLLVAYSPSRKLLSDLNKGKKKLRGRSDRRNRLLILLRRLATP